MDNFLQIIKNITVYLLLVGFILTFLGESAYKKYVQFFMGIVLILIIVSPVMELLSLDTIFQSKLEIGKIQLEYSEADALANTNQLMEEAEELQEKKLENQYQQMIKEYLNNSLREYPVQITNVVIELGEEVGGMNAMRVEYKELDEEARDQTEKAVDEIKIENITIEKEEKTAAEQLIPYTIMEEKILDKIETMYQLSRESIVLEKIK